MARTQTRSLSPAGLAARASVWLRVADSEDQWAAQQDAGNQELENEQYTVMQEGEEAQEMTGGDVTGCATRPKFC